MGQSYVLLREMGQSYVLLREVGHWYALLREVGQWYALRRKWVNRTLYVVNELIVRFTLGSGSIVHFA